MVMEVFNGTVEAYIYNVRQQLKEIIIKGNYTMKNEQKWLLQEMYNEGYRDIKIEGVYAFFVNPTFIENGGNFKIRDHTPRIPCKVLGLNHNTRKYSIASLLGIVEWEKVPIDTPIIAKTAFGK